MGTAEVTARPQEEQQKGRLREAGTAVNPVPSPSLSPFPSFMGSGTEAGKHSAPELHPQL